eukprot:TRINITY_DN10160_c0_g1_i2.p1 TRINITY_DN10160_c0_g1~~TRINITY_DN10160_c0_g1_i2.p1  ORF type:complete len:219 (+),score=29.64 TRINITY_DN10160_c0_g1_i2:229-885(+)
MLCKVMPKYELGCKRILLSDDYFPTLKRDNVELIDSAVEKISEQSIITKDGKEFPVDGIIYSTGFQTTKFLTPIKISGVDRSRDLRADDWNETDARAHFGLTVPGYPNFFLLYGPGTNLGHNSILIMVELQVEYIAQCIEFLAKEDKVKYIDVKKDAARDSVAKADARMKKTAFSSGCHSWYVNEYGRIPTNSPYRCIEYWWQIRNAAINRDFNVVPF